MGLKSLLHGRSAEQQAARYLRKHGVKVLEKNRRYKCGEIDIIALDNQHHLFVEVKFRADSRFGTASEMISTGKQTKLVKAAKLWLQENDPDFSRGCRFDVIAISRSNDSKTDSIEWIKNAFTPELW
jgi:putative endonuclease